MAGHPQGTGHDSPAPERTAFLSGYYDRREDDLDRQSLEDVLPARFRREVGTEHQGLPGNLTHRQQDPGPHDGAVLHLRAGQAPAAAPRPLYWRATPALGLKRS